MLVADLHLRYIAEGIGGKHFKPLVGVLDHRKIDAQLFLHPAAHGFAAVARRTAGAAVCVPVAGILLVIGAFHRLQIGAIHAPHVLAVHRAIAYRSTVGRKAHLAVVGHQHGGHLRNSLPYGAAGRNARNAGIAALAQYPAVGGHGLRLVGFGGLVAAQLVLGDHGQTFRKVHGLRHTVHGHIDGAALGALYLIRRALLAAAVQIHIPLRLLLGGMVLVQIRLFFFARQGIVKADVRAAHAAGCALPHIRFHGRAAARHIRQALQGAVGLAQQLVHLGIQLAQINIQCRVRAGRRGLLGHFGRRVVAGVIPVGPHAVHRGGIGGGFAHGGILRRRIQRCLGRLNGTGCQRGAFALPDQPPGHRQLCAGIVFSQQQCDKAIAPVHRHAGVHQAALLHADRKLPKCLVLAKALVLHGGKAIGFVIIIHGKHLAAIHAPRAVQRKARVVPHGLLHFVRIGCAALGQLNDAVSGRNRRILRPAGNIFLFAVSGIHQLALPAGQRQPCRNIRFLLALRLQIGRSRRVKIGCAVALAVRLKRGAPKNAMHGSPQHSHHRQHGQHQPHTAHAAPMGRGMRRRGTAQTAGTVRLFLCAARLKLQRSLGPLQPARIPACKIQHGLGAIFRLCPRRQGAGPCPVPRTQNGMAGRAVQCQLCAGFMHGACSLPGCKAQLTFVLIFAGALPNAPGHGAVGIGFVAKIKHALAFGLRPQCLDQQLGAFGAARHREQPGLLQGLHRRLRQALLVNAHHGIAEFTAQAVLPALAVPAGLLLGFTGAADQHRVFAAAFHQLQALTPRRLGKAQRQLYLVRRNAEQAQDGVAFMLLHNGISFLLLRQAARYGSFCRKAAPAFFGDHAPQG